MRGKDGDSIPEDHQTKRRGHNARQSKIKANGTSQVKSKKANSFHLYDLIGNVEEWVLDQWLTPKSSPPKSYEQITQTLSTCRIRCQESMSFRLRVGGHWATQESSASPLEWSLNTLDDQSFLTGFRPIRLLKQKGERVSQGNSLTQKK